MEDAALSVEEAARLLHVSRDTIYRLVRNAGIPGRKVGNQWRFSRSALLAWLAGTTSTARAHPDAPVDSPEARGPIPPKTGGAGLKGVISKRLGELLGRNVTVDSVPGQGHSFRVTIASASIDRIRREARERLVRCSHE